MTSGTKLMDGTYNVRIPLPGGGGYYNLLVGPTFFKRWSGGNAITAGTPRSSMPRLYPPKGYASSSKKKKGRPKLPPMAYNLDVTKSYQDYAYFKNNANGLVAPHASNATPAPGLETPDVSVDPKQEYKLIAKIQNRLYGSGFNPGVFAAEGKQAVGMIANAATRLGSALRRLRARDPHGVLEALGLEPDHGFARTLKDRRIPLSKAWLEVQYGWKPLLNDAEDGAAWIATATHQASTVLRIRVKREWQDVKVGSSPADGTTRLTMRETFYHLSYTIATPGRSNSFLPSVASVAAIAWEKLPYSFVVDWFAPIGSYLEALRTSSAVSGQVVRSLKVTTKYSDPKRTGFTMAGSWTLGRGPELEYVHFRRTILPGIIVPPPINMGTFESLLEYKSLLHAINAVALLGARKYTTVFDTNRYTE